MIGNNPPSTYLVRMQRNAGIDETRMDEILESHLIDPLALRLDEFDEFFKARETALLDRIQQAMGKPIARGVAVPEDIGIDSFEDEELIDV